MLWERERRGAQTA